MDVPKYVPSTYVPQYVPCASSRGAVACPVCALYPVTSNVVEWYFLTFFYSSSN